MGVLTICAKGNGFEDAAVANEYEFHASAHEGSGFEKFGWECSGWNLFLKSRKSSLHLKQDVSTVDVLRAWWRRASLMANTSIEACAEHAATQTQKILGTGDEMTALQDEVASGTERLHGGRMLRASKHAGFVSEEAVSHESKSGLRWTIRVFFARWTRFSQKYVDEELRIIATDIENEFCVRTRSRRWKDFSVRVNKPRRRTNMSSVGEYWQPYFVS